MPLTQYLPKRKNDANKGDFGHALIIGGDYNMGGALIMAAEGAFRVGCGKVSVLTRKENFSQLLTRLPNAMTAAFDGNNYLEIEKNKNVIVIGCGLGRSAWANELFMEVLNSIRPKILDADALNILSESKKSFDLSNTIITPHVGEAARLLALSTDEIQQDRELSVKKLYDKFGAITVLKGYGTLILGHNQKITKCEHGNAGMATAGMGDVLAGIIGGLVAQNLDLEAAAIAGVNIHALAGDLVAKKQGEIGMIPSDLFEYLPQIINNKICK